MDRAIDASDDAHQGTISFSLLQELVDLHRGNVQELQTDLGVGKSKVANECSQDTGDAPDVHGSEVRGAVMSGGAYDIPALAHVGVESPLRDHPTSEVVSEQVFGQQAGCGVEKPHEPAEAAATTPTGPTTSWITEERGQPLMTVFLPSQPGQDGTEQHSAPNGSVPVEATKPGSEAASMDPSQAEVKSNLGDTVGAEASADPDAARMSAASSVSPSAEQQGGAPIEHDAEVASRSETSGATAGLTEEGVGNEKTTNDMSTVISSPGGAVESSAYKATKAILYNLIAGGAAGARPLVVMAGRAGASPSYRAAAATSNAIRAAHPNRFWTDVECVRLTICSDETLPIYLQHKVIKLRSQCFGHSDEITTLGRTTLVLYNVDSKQVIGVWAAIAKDHEFITWQVLKNLPGMPSRAFQESHAGAVFPELPPTDTSVQARGDAARTVLRVLFEYAASVGQVASLDVIPGNIEMLRSSVRSDQNAVPAVCDVTEESDQPALAAEVVGPPSDEVMQLADQQEATDTVANEAFMGFGVEGRSTVAMVQENDLSMEAVVPATQVSAEARAAVVETDILSVEGTAAIATEAYVAKLETDGTAAREVQAAAAKEAAREAAAAAEAEAAEAAKEAKVVRETEAAAVRDVEVHEERPQEAKVEVPAAEFQSPAAVIVSSSATTASNGTIPTSEATGSSVTDATAPLIDVLATAVSAAGTRAPAPLVVPAHSSSPVANGPAMFPYNPVVPVVRVLSSQLRAASPTTAMSAPKATAPAVPVVAVPIAGTAAAAPVVQAAPIVVAATIAGGGSRPAAAPAAGGAVPRPYMPPFFFLQQQRLAAAAAAAAQPQPAAVVNPPVPTTQVQPAQEIKQEQQMSQTAAQPSTTEPQHDVSQPWPPSEPAEAQPPLQMQPAAQQATGRTHRTTAQATEGVQLPAQPRRNPSTRDTHRAPQPAQAARQLRNVPSAIGTLAPVPMQVVGQQPKPVVVRQGRAPTSVRVPAQAMAPAPVTSAVQPPAPAALGATVAALAPVVSTGPTTSSEAPIPVPGAVAPPAAQGSTRQLNFLAATARSSVRPLMAGPNQQIARPLRVPPAGMSVSNWPGMQSADSYGVPSNPAASATAPHMVQPWAAAPAANPSPAPATDAPSEGSAARLICPLCQQRTGCWFLLSCSHMGPCEECCASVKQVKEAYPNCARCGKAVDDKIMKARVS